MNNLPLKKQDSGAVARAPDLVNEIERAANEAPTPTITEPEWQSEAFAFLYGLLGGHPDTAPNVLRMNPEVRASLHRAVYERKPRDEPYDDMMARLCPAGLPGASHSLARDEGDSRSEHNPLNTKDTG